MNVFLQIIVLNESKLSEGKLPSELAYKFPDKQYPVHSYLIRVIASIPLIIFVVLVPYGLCCCICQNRH